MEDVVAFEDGVLKRASILGHLAVVPHDHVGVSNRVEFVDLVLLTQLVKLAVEATHESKHVCRLRLLTEFGHSRDLSVQQGHLLQVVDNFLVVLDALEDVLGDQFGEKFLSSLDLNIDNSIVVVDFTGAHLPLMNQQHVEIPVDYDEGAVGDVRLEVDDLLADMPVVLYE